VRGSDALALAMESLRLHRLRTLLTAAAVAVGATAVLLLTTLGDAAKAYVIREFASIGTNLVIVLPGRVETSGIGAAIGRGTKDLTLEDCSAIARRVTLANVVAPMSLGSAPFLYGGRRRDVFVVGTTSDYQRIRHLVVAAGSFLPPGDPHRGDNIAVVGSKLAREVFGAENPLGRTVRISATRFRVIGVLEPKGQSMAMNLDDMALIPVGAGMRLFNQSGLFRVVAQARETGSIPAVIAGIREVLTERHRDEDFTIITQDAMLKSFRSVIDALTAALAGIAAISFAVAGIGIMNVMLVSVSERVAEVGLLKALGARPRQIVALFLSEALALSSLGAVAGLLVGLALIWIAAGLWPSFGLRPGPGWIAAVVVLSVLAGGVFGLLPARRAARLPAAEALRGKR
jgi:putative ABC transport system permease protein